jgi:trimethylamine--corrinoid protein Co-methyltransferase
MNMFGTVLNVEEMDAIHMQSLSILEDIGVRVPSEKVLGTLEDVGATIDWQEQIAKIPRELVTKSLSLCPKTFTLGARVEAKSLALPGKISSINLDGTGTRMRDFHTGKRRDALLDDVAKAARVFDAMDVGTVLWPPVVARDVPTRAAGFLGAATAFMNSGKHIQDEIKKEKEVYYVEQLLTAILGSREAVVEKKIYSATYCTVAPLSHDKEMLEGTLALTRLKAPVLMYPMPASGSTGPASLYANLALANAEILSCIVIFQATTPGTPLIYGAALGAVDLRSGAYLEGGVETALQLTAMTQMGKHYGFPTIVAGCLTDAHEMGFQTALEKTLTCLPLVLAGCDVVQGAGFLESSMTLCLEQILLDGEILELCNRMAKGVDTRSEKALMEEISRVGPGGHFLKEKSTRQLFRSEEYYMPTLSVREPYESWCSLGSPDMICRAREQVERILREEPAQPLSESVGKAIQEIMEEARENL